MGSKAIMILSDDVRAEGPSNQVIVQRKVYAAKDIEDAIDNEIESIYLYDKFENIAIGFLTEFSNSQFKSLAIRKPFLGVKLNSTSYNLTKKFELLFHLLRKFHPNIQLTIGKNILKQISNMIIEKDKWCFLTLTEVRDAIQGYQDSCLCFNKSLPYKPIKKRVDEFNVFLESLEAMNFQRTTFDESTNNKSAIETAINTEESQIVKRMGCLANYYKKVISQGGIPKMYNGTAGPVPAVAQKNSKLTTPIPTIINGKPTNSQLANTNPNSFDPNAYMQYQKQERDTMMLDAMRMYKNQAIKVNKLFPPPTPPPSKHDMLNDKNYLQEIIGNYTINKINSIESGMELPFISTAKLEAPENPRKEVVELKNEIDFKLQQSDRAPPTFVNNNVLKIKSKPIISSDLLRSVSNAETSKLDRKGKSLGSIYLNQQNSRTGSRGSIKKKGQQSQQHLSNTKNTLPPDPDLPKPEKTPTSRNIGVQTNESSLGAVGAANVNI